MSISDVMASLKLAWSWSSAFGHCSRAGLEGGRGGRGVDAVRDLHVHLAVELVRDVGVEGVEADEVVAVAGTEHLPVVERLDGELDVAGGREAHGEGVAEARGRAPRPGGSQRAMPSPCTSGSEPSHDLEVHQLVDGGGVDGQHLGAALADVHRGGAHRGDGLDARAPPRGRPRWWCRSRRRPTNRSRRRSRLAARCRRPPRWRPWWSWPGW